MKLKRVSTLASAPSSLVYSKSICRSAVRWVRSLRVYLIRAGLKSVQRFTSVESVEPYCWV